MEVESALTEDFIQRRRADSSGNTVDDAYILQHTFYSYCVFCWRIFGLATSKQSPLRKLSSFIEAVQE